MNFTGRILITDDEAHIRKFLTLVVKKLGDPTVLEAANGQEAVSLYQSRRPHLVLLDVNMPVLDGVQALEQIKRLDPDAVVVMLTSLANRQTVEDCARFGAVSYLRKDLQREELLAQLSQVIAENFQTDESPPVAAES